VSDISASDQSLTPSSRRKKPGLLTRLALSPRFHALAERVPFLRGHARAEGRALFDILSGFVQSQALTALVELRLLHRLAEGPATPAALALYAQMPVERLAVLVQAGAALKLVRHRTNLWHLTPRGAAFLAVPGLEAMVRHDSVLYRDLSDPAAFFRGQTNPELAGFWPYVFGELAQSDPALAARYSSLMSDSQGLVAADTLRMVDLKGSSQLMDVGGGTGAFLRAVRAKYPALGLTLFDLPDVLAGADPAIAGLSLRPGSFRTDPLPTGADVISLVRVLYDHPDTLVATLLAKVFAALPPGGRLIVSEPMSGGARPDPQTDIYFAVYTMAMRTGRTRSAAEISQALVAAGFSVTPSRAAPRPFITSVIEARRSAA
jgi:demethylspheroidene O-methyltransferase